MWRLKFDWDRKVARSAHLLPLQGLGLSTGILALLLGYHDGRRRLHIGDENPVLVELNHHVLHEIALRTRIFNLAKFHSLPIDLHLKAPAYNQLKSPPILSVQLIHDTDKVRSPQIKSGKWNIPCFCHLQPVDRACIACLPIFASPVFKGAIAQQTAKVTCLVHPLNAHCSQSSWNVFCEAFSCQILCNNMARSRSENQKYHTISKRKQPQLMVVYVNSILSRSLLATSKE